MKDRVLIVGGLIVFLALVTYPVWHDLVAHASAKGPNLGMPAGEKQCVAPLNEMKTSHMQLLLTWRDDVVRNDVRNYRAFTGKTYTMSLSGTCLRCHNKEQFCDRCHTYVGVSTPYCWDCHVDPAQVRRSAL